MDRRTVPTKPRLQPRDISMEDSRDVVTYHIEEETGALTQTSISPNKNHITARVVSSPHDVVGNVHSSELRPDRSGVHVPKHYEYIPTSYTSDVHPSFINTPFVIMGKELRHPKEKARLSGYPLSDIEIEQRNHRFAEVDYARGHHRSEGTSSRDNKSSGGSGNFKSAKYSRAAKIESTKSHKTSTSAKSHESDSNILEERSVKKTKPPKFTTQIKEKLDTIYTEGVKRHGHLSHSDPGDGELRGQGPTDRHVLSTLLVTVPGTANAEGSQASKESTGHRKTHRKHKKHHHTHTLPRYGSLDSMSQFYAQPEFQGNLANWNMPLDPANNYGQLAYVGEDGRVYLQNWTGYYPYSENQWTYPSWRCNSGTDLVTGFGDLRVQTTSSDDTSEEVDHATKGKIKTKARMIHQTRSDMFRQNKPRNRDLSKSVASYTHKSPRSRLYKDDVRSYPSTENKAGNRRHVKERASNYTDDLKAKEKDNKDTYSDKSSSTYTSDQQSRHQNTTSGSKKDSPRRGTHENLVPSSRLVDSNFTLASDPSPVSGFPHSVAAGHLDQILRNTNLNLATMRSYLDALSTSLASIPAATTGNFQRQSDLTGDTLDNVEHQEFFKNTDLTTASKRTTGLTHSPVYSYAKSNEQKAERNNIDNGCGTLDSCSVISDYLDGPSDWKSKNSSSLHTGRERNYGKCFTAEIYPRSAAELEQLESTVNKGSGDTMSHRMFHETNVGQDVRDVMPRTNNGTGNNRRQQLPASRLLSSASSDFRQLPASRLLSSASSDFRQLPVVNSSNMTKKDTGIQTDFDSNTISHVASFSPVYPTGNTKYVDHYHGMKSNLLTSDDGLAHTVHELPHETLTNSKRMTERLGNGFYSEPYRTETATVCNNTSNISLGLHDARDISQTDHSRSVSLPPPDRVSDIVEDDGTRGVRISLATERFGNTGTLTGPTANLTQERHIHTCHVPEPQEDYDTCSAEPAGVHIPSKTYIQIDKPETVIAYQKSTLSPTSDQSPIVNSQFDGCIFPVTSSQSYLAKCLNVRAQAPARFAGSPRTTLTLKGFSPLIPPTRSPESEKRRGKSLSKSFKLSRNESAAVFHSPAPTSDTKQLQACQVLPHKSRDHIWMSPDEMTRASLRHSSQPSTAHTLPATPVQEVPFQIYRGSPHLLKSSQKKAHSLPGRKASKNRETRTHHTDLKHSPLSNYSVNTMMGYKEPNKERIASKHLLHNEIKQEKHGYLNGHSNSVVNKAQTCGSSKTARCLPESFTDRSNRTMSAPSGDLDGDGDISEYLYTSKGWSHVPPMTSAPTVMICWEDNRCRHFQQVNNSLLVKDKSFDDSLDTLIKDFGPKQKSDLDFFNVPLPLATQLLGIWPKVITLTADDTSRNSNFNMTSVQRKWTNKLPLYSLLSKKEILYPKAGDFTFDESIASFNTTISLHSFHNDERSASFISELSSPSQRSDILDTYISSSTVDDQCFCVDDVWTRVEDTPKPGHVSDTEPCDISVAFDHYRSLLAFVIIDHVP